MNKYKINFSLKFGVSLVVMMLYLILSPPLVKALTPGTIVYRTTNDGKMFGYSKDPLLEIENGILIGINPGHAGIYIGQENGEDYIVEALAGGIVKTPAKYFVNEALGEELVAARLPREASALDRLKAVMIAKNLADANLDYDLSFQKQKGPGDGEWTCVGLTEKIYESAGVANPGDIKALVYDPEQYRINITPDGFDNREIVNDEGDCISKNKEFSKIARREDLSIPLPEIIGYNAGREYRGERYFFLPYTQMIQPSLRAEVVDINLSSNFDSKEVRGKTPTLGVLLRWSLINNPASTIKAVAGKVKTVASHISSFIFGQKSTNELVLSSSFNDVSANQASASQSNQESISDIVRINTANVSVNTSSKIKTRAEDASKSVAPSQAENLAIKSDVVKLPEVAKVEAGKVQASSEPVSDLSIQSSSAFKTAVTKITAAASSVANKPISSAIKIEYSPDSAAASRITTGVKPVGSSNAVPAAGSNNASPSTALTTALISKIYATDNNDFIELYNPLDFDFDLAEEGFRLEKTKTAEDPSLMMRIGEAADGYYPKGTIIKAKSFYLIVRDDASQYYLDMADAIATRKEFSWTGSGYTIYLGKGAIS